MLPEGGLCLLWPWKSIRFKDFRCLHHRQKQKLPPSVGVLFGAILAGTFHALPSQGVRRVQFELLQFKKSKVKSNQSKFTPRYGTSSSSGVTSNSVESAVDGLGKGYYRWRGEELLYRSLCVGVNWLIRYWLNLTRAQLDRTWCCCGWKAIIHSHTQCCQSGSLCNCESERAVKVLFQVHAITWFDELCGFSNENVCVFREFSFDLLIVVCRTDCAALVTHYNIDAH